VGSITIAGTRITLGGIGNDFVGDVFVNSGSKLQTDSAGALPFTTQVTLSGTGILQLNASISQNIDALNGTGTVTIVAGGAAVLTIGSNGGSGSFSGTMVNGAAALSIAKNGAGAQTLSGALTHTGTTTVNGGTLLVNGSKSGTGAVSVNSGGTLGGTGTVAGVVAVNSGGHLAPGAEGAGQLTLSGGLTLADGAVLDWDIGAGTDLLRVSGGTVTGAGPGGVTLNLAGAGRLQEGSYILMDWSGATATGVEPADFVLMPPAMRSGAQVSIQGSQLVLQVMRGGLLIVR
jgi:autotransporter-associated beta strand protein